MFKRFALLSLPRLVLAGALCTSAPALAALSFDLSVATKYKVAAHGDNPPPDEVRQFKVVLGERYLSVSSPSESTIYDLATRRRYQIDLASRRYVDYSLFDEVGFRVQELKNRSVLNKSLSVAKVDLPAFDPVFDEHQLSVASAARKLSESTEAGATVLAVDGNPLAHIPAGGTRVSAADAALFERMMRYRFGGHPLVLARLASEKRVPAGFVMYHKQIGNSQARTYTISALKESAPASYDLKPYQPRAAAASELDQLLDKAQAGAAPPAAASRQAFETGIAQAFADKRALDAMLGMSEWSFVSGEPMKTPTPEQKVLLNADPQVRAFAAAMRPKGKAEMEEAVARLQELRKLTTQKQHMLMLFEANWRARLGDVRGALPLYASVLRANPALAGAYKDMGDALHQNYDMPRAWRSWDAGRRMAPGLALFKAVNQYEQQLLREHPEFF
ncbi:hypothetical protein [Massilia antarctica]|uniref:hypothetical protein n=1 Tax=Massilia antarctica TaxID=2765360 RepID=UPI0006BB908A|nr:hypothetical protein [Massilia sp. H27-R4]MCY0914967.1 hypothetical protein [Massilia sp. H27-R4]CUI06933.1 hypothetical protein BN2497_8643 [Janthinobacterium sp. CG23_2]CUU30719.1 hypothetical protein BN3177_8643 [Janthinobacterium sp. CG23_2]